MRKFTFFKLLFAVSFILVNSFGFAQKNPIANNFSSPFGVRNSVTAKSSPISPQIDKTSIVKQTDEYILQNNGKSFLLNFSGKKNVSKRNAFEEIIKILNLNESTSLDFIKSETDEFGIIHSKYQQTYKGIPIEGNIIITHEHDGVIKIVNGQVENISDFSITPSIGKTKAIDIAQSFVNSKNILSVSEPVIVIVSDGKSKKLSYKIRIDALEPLFMKNIFVDATTGKILNSISLIANTDVTGTASTYYSGSQTITADSYSGYYRLRENARKIQTFNGTNDNNFVQNVGFTNPQDFYDSDNNWTAVPYLSSITISYISSSWWYTFMADELPDLYILVKDGSNNIVYGSSSNYINNTQPPLTFSNINLTLTNPPYTVEIWDYDAANSDDFGGSYSINTSTGTHNYSGNGNGGAYTVNQFNNPALDVHWGIEKTYDYFLSKHSRNSYDNAGATIKNFINPTYLFGSNPNNAFALNAPYNIMCYGMGDGSIMNPVVGLDVTAHEFTHMVTNHSAQLVYQAESGALNESFSDIFACGVEFYSGVNTDWFIGEGIMIQGSYMRNMANPNDRQQPDTYQGQYWQDINNLQADHGGVHTNSGVMNYWFYLLCQGGSGTNDLGNAYSVTAIGITKAEKIAYRNLTVYLTPNATHYDAMIGSLQAAQDLYGASSPEYWAVKDAWYAVGLGNTSNNVFCSGLTELTNSSGTITDGSGTANYLEYADCSWLIIPTGANTISINFTYFDTEAGYDSVMVYDGPDATSPLLMTWWGNTLPPTITSSGGAMFIRFLSDESVNAGGWSANYSSTGTATCDGGSILTSPSGTFSDGSGSGNYGNNQLCYWLIAPPCANNITLSFSAFNTEAGYDGIIVFDGNNTNAPQLLNTSGTSIPSSVTSSGGEMLVVFVSDYMVTYQGFTANYTSTGTPYCSGTTNATIDAATFSDGSGSNNYCNNMSCSWLLQPTGATTVSLVFTEFDLELPAEDGTMYDYIEVFNGTNSSAPLLGKFSGGNLPPTITSTGGSMFVRFTTDFSVTRPGWSAYYYCTTNNYCSGNTVLTSSSGTFSDGSGANQYGNNAECSWLIQPTNAQSITLTFTAFDTEDNYDGVIVYDGSDETAPTLGSFTGSTIPSPVTSTGGSMYVVFLSDFMVRDNGWSATYSSVITDLSDIEFSNAVKIYPNPNNGNFKIDSPFDGCKLEIFDLTSRKCYLTQLLEKGTNSISISDLSKGVYIVKLQNRSNFSNHKLVIK
jgi:Zn-dependent metalloprotease